MYQASPTDSARKNNQPTQTMMNMTAMDIARLNRGPMLKKRVSADLD
jgi:hypothetical protein